jgi:hypothetical protein
MLIGSYTTGNLEARKVKRGDVVYCPNEHALDAGAMGRRRLERAITRSMRPKLVNFVPVRLGYRDASSLLA